MTKLRIVSVCCEFLLVEIRYYLCIYFLLLWVSNRWACFCSVIVWIVFNALQCYQLEIVKKMRIRRARTKMINGYFWIWLVRIFAIVKPLNLMLSVNLILCVLWEYLYQIMLTLQWHQFISYSLKWTPLIAMCFLKFFSTFFYCEHKIHVPH